MADEKTNKETRTVVSNAHAGGGSAVYAFGLIGAFVYFFQQANTMGEYLLAIIQALLWPAFLVYKAFESLA